MIPIRTDRRLQHTPWVNYTIIAANAFVFIVLQRVYSGSVHHYVLHPEQPQLHQFFSSMFMHAGWLHLIGNMIFLWVFGNAVNDMLGHVGYLAFYLAGGIVAGIGHALLGGGASAWGASGAIAAVTGAFFVLFPRVRVTVLFILYFIIPMEIPSWVFMLLQLIWNLGFAAAPQGGGNIAYVAHLSGYFFGIGLAAGLMALKVLPSEPYNLLNLIRQWRRRSGYQRAVAGGFDPFGRGHGRSHRGRRDGGGADRWARADTVENAPPQPGGREAQLRAEIAEAHRGNDYDAAAKAYLRLVQIADNPILPMAQQLDVANTLMGNEKYPGACDAYERFLDRYGQYEHIGDIRLMLGLIYGRYLRQYDRAEKYLSRAIPDLLDDGKVAMAEEELAKARRRLGR